MFLWLVVIGVLDFLCGLKRRYKRNTVVPITEAGDRSRRWSDGDSGAAAAATGSSPSPLLEWAR